MESDIGTESFRQLSLAWRMERQGFGKEGGVQCHHAVYSLDPNDPKSKTITDRELADIGHEFVAKVAPNHSYAVFVHRDRDHPHIHIVWSSLDLETGKKYQMGPSDLRKAKEIKNEIDKAHGIAITTRKPIPERIPNEVKRQLDRKPDSYAWTLDLGQRIHQAVEKSDSMEDFPKHLKQLGVNVTIWQNKNMTFRFTDEEGKQHAKRHQKLGENYSYDTIATAIRNKHIEHEEIQLTRSIESLGRSTENRHHEASNTQRGTPSKDTHSDRNSSNLHDANERETLRRIQEKSNDSTRTDKDNRDSLKQLQRKLTEPTDASKSHVRIPRTSYYDEKATLAIERDIDRDTQRNHLERVQGKLESPKRADQSDRETPKPHSQFYESFRRSQAPKDNVREHREQTHSDDRLSGRSTTGDDSKKDLVTRGSFKKESALPMDSDRMSGLPDDSKHRTDPLNSIKQGSDTISKTTDRSITNPDNSRTNPNAKTQEQAIAIKEKPESKRKESTHGINLDLPNGSIPIACKSSEKAKALHREIYLAKTQLDNKASIIENLSYTAAIITATLRQRQNLPNVTLVLGNETRTLEQAIKRAREIDEENVNAGHGNLFAIDSNGMITKGRVTVGRFVPSTNIDEIQITQKDIAEKNMKMMEEIKREKAQKESHQKAITIAKEAKLELVEHGQMTRHTGTIIATTKEHVIQDTGSKHAVIHRIEDLDRKPQVGETATIQYNKGKGNVHVKEKAKSKEIEIDI
jgi:hypothetical protein